MEKQLQHFLPKMQLMLIPLLLMLAQYAWSQCTNAAQFGSINAPTNNTTTTITTCAFGGEYSIINSCTAGSTYLFNATGGAGNYITIRQGTPGGAVLGFGFAPISVVCTASGPLYLHYNTNAACGTDGSCHTGTVQCTSCPGASDPCNSITTLNCNTAVSATLSGSGLWSPGSCGFSTPGTEKIYSFTPSTTGVHSLQVNTTNSGGFIDYFIKAASGGCNSSGWTCIDDIFSPSTVSMGTLTAGVQYYILLDPETSASVTHNFQIVCPTAIDPCASITTLSCNTAVSATLSGTGIWSPGSCGFSTPGTEKIYSFTPSTTGVHNLQVNSASGGYIDYFLKDASGGCNSSSWTCIDDVNIPVTTNMGTLTAGVQYYILLDPEVTTSVTHNFQIVCPAPGTAPACAAAPSSPANGANAGCPNAPQTLIWPTVATATDYDVYFGTSATPPFVATVTGTSYPTGVLAAGTYFWQIRPKNSFGTAAGCTVWSFSRIDNVAPSITCPANVLANNNPATACSAVVTYGAVSATDNCTAPTILLISGLASGATYPVGITTNTYRATDGANNTATCSFTVTVRDVTPPSITCPANIVTNNSPATACSAVVTYAVTATDNCTAPAISLLSGLASGATFPVGTTVNVWRATDVGNNTTTCSFSVKVNDATPPTITCPNNIQTGNDWNQCSKTLTFIGTPTVGDNCNVSQLSNNSPVNFPLGTTTVTYTLKDAAGNSSTCQQTVTINDIQQPNITCPNNIVTLTDLGQCNATVNFSVNASDNCPNFSVEYSQNPQSTFELGYTGVSATVTDAQGLSANCSFLIQVKERKETCNGFDDDCDGLVDETEDWTPIGKRLASNGGAFDAYGGSVDIDGAWAIVGSNHKAQGQSLGTAYILTRDPAITSTWVEIALLLPPSVQTGDNFGASVAIADGIAAVGAPQDDEGAPNGGAVYLFHQAQNNPTQWDFVKKVFPADPSTAANFGSSVSLDGGRLLVGATLDDAAGSNSGAAYLFARNLGGSDNWGQVSKLVASDGGNDDQFGGSVSLNGSNALVGATGDDDKGANAGAAYVFSQNTGGAGAWGQQAKLVASNGQADDNAGISVSISGSYALVGADGSDLKASNAGAVFVYAFGPNGWQQQNYIVESNGAADDRFGKSVSIDAEYAAVGAPGDDPYGNNSGRAFAFLRVSNGWAQVGLLSDGSGKSNDALGSSIAISGRTIIAGVPNDDVIVNSDQGSVMLFSGLCADPQPRDAFEESAELPNNGLTVECFPVPFDDQLTVRVTAHTTDVRIQCNNALGQLVSTLYEGALDGTAQFNWETARLQPGVYFLRVQAGDQMTTKAVLLTR